MKVYPKKKKTDYIELVNEKTNIFKQIKHFGFCES